MEAMFPVVLYILGAVLLILLIILTLKLIYTVDKTNEILDDVHEKVRTLDGLFHAIEVASSTITNISDTIFDKFFGILGKITGRNKKNKRMRKEEEF